MDPFFTREKFIVRNGSQTRFWEDLWIGKDSLIMKQYPLLYNSDREKNQTVADVLCTRLRCTTGNPQIAVYQNVCRVPIETAHNKLFLCRVSGQKTHGKCPTHSKLQHLPCAAKGCTWQTFSTWQNCAKKGDTPLLIFSAMHIQCIVLLVKIWYISHYFGYIQSFNFINPSAPTCASPPRPPSSPR